MPSAGVLILAAECSGPWSRWLGTRVPVFLGTISYGLYVWQQLFLTQLNTTFSGLCPVSVLGAQACAVVSFHAI
jgi:peptidoglycan/LPS O-acetylase OafA/YrhL